MQSPPATSEYLEALNVELSQRLGTAPRTLELLDHNPVQATEKPFDVTVVRINRNMLNYLTEEEVAFMMASRLLQAREIEAMYVQIGKDPFHVDLKAMNRDNANTKWIMVLVAASTMSVAILMTGGRDPLMWVLTIGCLLILAFGDTFINRRFKDPGYLETRMLKLAPEVRQKFDEAARLVGNPEAGERYFRKLFVLDPTDCGEKPFDQDMRRKAQLNYEINVPPEYQVPGAIDSMAAILNS